jgi:hypothetical protein
MEQRQIRELVASLDTGHPSEQQHAWPRLRPLGADIVPYLVEFYPRARRPQARADLVCHCMPYGRQSEAAFNLGLSVLDDESYLVRYRACELPAYSLRCEALPALEGLLEHPDPRTVEDARAAVGAIRAQNHHYFIDRDHSGRARWFVGGADGSVGAT